MAAFFGRPLTSVLASVSGMSARTRGKTSESARSGSALARVAAKSPAEGPVSYSAGPGPVSVATPPRRDVVAVRDARALTTVAGSGASW